MVECDCIGGIGPKDADENCLASSRRGMNTCPARNGKNYNEYRHL